MILNTQLTNNEKKAIDELRKRVQGELSSELYEDMKMFYRFLKARDFNIDHSEEMLKKHIQWRKDYLVDTILQEYVPNEGLSKFFPGNVIGFDKDHCPVKYYAFGNLDAKGVRRISNFTELMRYETYCHEKEIEILKQQCRKHNKDIPGFVYILDFKNQTFSEATDMKTMEHVKILANMYQENYPETLKAAYVVNVSPYFYLMFNILKVLLAATILRKLHLYQKDFQESLLKVIDADQLPAFLGGNKTDPDGNPLCLSFVNHAGKVPEKYFRNKCSIEFENMVDVHKLIVQRSSTEEVRIHVDKPGCFIEWEFEIQSRDIEFGVLFEDSAENRYPIIPVKKIYEEQFTEMGFCKAKKAGTYILVFNNSYSWMRTKDITYRAVVRNPDIPENNASD